MHKGRLEAFSDGVIAIIITIMVLELKVPHEGTFEALKAVIPIFLSYAFSFIFVGIYWNNHHHMLQAAHKVSGGILWANLHLLFWLSIIPFVTSWMGENHFAPVTVALYGLVLLLCGVAYNILFTCLAKIHGNESIIAKALGKDIKGKISLVVYLTAIPIAFYSTWISGALYISIAILWLVPDKRIEHAMSKAEQK